MPTDVQHQIRQFIEDNFLFRTDGQTLSETESLLAAELIDSTGVLELVAFLESQFGIAVADAEIVPENLDSIRAITAYVERKLAPAVVAA